MGYNPFRPHMSFSSGATTGTTTTTTTAATGVIGATSSGSTVGGNYVGSGNGNGGLALKSNDVTGLLDQEAAAAAEEAAMAEVDDAFAMLLSLGIYSMSI